MYPQILPIVKRLFRAFGSFVKTWVLSVLRVPHNQGVFVLDEVRSKRMASCASCPNYSPEIDMCGLCFCKMSIKTRLIESTCPVKRW